MNHHLDWASVQTSGMAAMLMTSPVTGDYGINTFKVIIYSRSNWLSEDLTILVVDTSADIWNFISIG